jgi:predicted kinase
MQRQTLYMLVGYPGSGKTTTSRIIHELTGAEHIWADQERGKMFEKPTHSKHESRVLYDDLNLRIEKLLAEGKSVIFDTNFNFYKDRQLMRDIAAKHNALAVLVWVKADIDLARERATHIQHSYQNGYSVGMPVEQFNRMAGNLQHPEDDEQPIILDGTKITPEYVAGKLGITA